LPEYEHEQGEKNEPPEESVQEEPQASWSAKTIDADRTAFYAGEDQRGSRDQQEEHAFADD
jgi:hypothetical protein